MTNIGVCYTNLLSDGVSFHCYYCGLMVKVPDERTLSVAWARPPSPIEVRCHSPNVFFEAFYHRGCALTLPLNYRPLCLRCRAKPCRWRFSLFLDIINFRLLKVVHLCSLECQKLMLSDFKEYRGIVPV